MTDAAAYELDDDARGDKALRFVNSGDFIVNLVMGLELWSRYHALGTLAALAGLMVARVAFNVVGNNFFLRSGKSRASGNLMAAGNMCLSLAFIHLGEWSTVACMQIVLMASAMDTFFSRDSGLRLTGWLTAVGILATVDRAPASSVFVSAVITVMVYVASSLRWGALIQALNAARSNHREAVEANAHLERLHHALLEKEKLSSMGLVAAGLAHEINNPMTYVTGNLQLLLKDLPSVAQNPELRREYEEVILPATLDGARRVNSIISDLRRFARGDLERFVPFQLNDEVTSAVRMAQKGLEGVCTLELRLGELPRLVGRPSQLGQVVTNLLRNSAQALAGRGGRIRIETRSEETEVVLVVTDDGKGMSEEVRRKVFEPFFTTKPAGEGMGLGLSVVHGIVSAHGGTIDVESELGRGTTVTVHLPLARTHVQTPTGPDVQRE